jgi:RNA polymerase sigma factor (sigma-70 family)
VDQQGIGTVTSTEQDRQISEVMAAQSPRLRNFIRRRVPGGEDADDILQEVFYELVRAHRLLMPIDTVSSWLYSVARNRITDLFRKKTPDLFTDLAVEGEAGGLLDIEDLLPSPDAGPEAAYLRKQLLVALESAIADLPPEQRAVFVANELEGRSFKELAAETGISINTLLSRKRYAVLSLRRRLETIHKEFIRK